MKLEKKATSNNRTNFYVYKTKIFFKMYKKS